MGDSELDAQALSYRLSTENQRLRDLIRSIHLCSKPARRDLDQLARDMHLIYDLTRADAAR